MSPLDENRLSYRSVWTSLSTVYRSLVWRLRENERARAVLLRVCVSLVWAVIVGSLGAAAALALGMTASEIVLAGLVNGAGAAVVCLLLCLRGKVPVIRTPP
jgi:hypothetical protein